MSTASSTRCLRVDIPCQRAVRAVGRGFGDPRSRRNRCSSASLAEISSSSACSIVDSNTPAGSPTRSNQRSFSSSSADTPFGEVKISELPSWFGRRNMSPVAITQACGRAYWRWNHRYWLAKKTTPSGIYQALVMSMLLFYAMNSNRLGEHARAKYH